MFRGLLSSRLIQVGLVFFVVVVSGSLLYSWQTRRATVAEFPQTDAVLHETRSEQVTVDTSTVDFEQSETPLELDDLQMADDTDVSPIDETSEMLDMADAFLPDDFVSEEAPAEDVPVSPYGFGPYPEVPEDYPWKVNWEKKVDREGELLERVLIEVWKQDSGGINGGSTVTTNGQLRVLPHYHNTVYVTWADHIGVDGTVKWKYIADLTSGLPPSVILPIVETNEIPPGIQVLDPEVDSINPYEFLNLPK